MEKPANLGFEMQIMLSISINQLVPSAIVRLCVRQMRPDLLKSFIQVVINE